MSAVQWLQISLLLVSCFLKFALEMYLQDCYSFARRMSKLISNFPAVFRRVFSFQQISGHSFASISLLETCLTCYQILQNRSLHPALQGDLGSEVIYCQRPYSFSFSPICFDFGVSSRRLVTFESYFKSSLRSHSVLSGVPLFQQAKTTVLALYVLNLVNKCIQCLGLRLRIKHDCCFLLN